MYNFYKGTLVYRVGSPYGTSKQRIETLTKDEDILVDAIADESGEPAVLVVAVGKAGTLFTENGDLKPGVPATFLKADYRRTMPVNLFSMVRSLIAESHYGERDAEGMGYYIQCGMVQNHISGEAFARWQPDPPQA